MNRFITGDLYSDCILDLLRYIADEKIKTIVDKESGILVGYVIQYPNEDFLGLSQVLHEANKS